MLPDDAFVMLDPAVEVLHVEPAFSLLGHVELEVAMVVPPGEGILDVVRSLMGKPVHVGALRDEYDDRTLIDGMLASLHGRGLAHVTSQDAPSDDALAELRDLACRRVARSQRRTVDLDLDVLATLEQRCAVWTAGETSPEVVLRCARLSDHAVVLDELSRGRHSGELRAHHVIVRAADVRCDDALRDALIRLGAAVEIEGVAWPAPDAPVPGLAELARHRLAVHVIMRPGAAILDADARDRAIAWITREAVSGLCLRLDAPDTPDDATTDAALVRVFEAVRALEVALADVVVLDLPSDEVLIGNVARRPLPAARAARQLRRAYVRWRVPIVKSFESAIKWPQIPELEHKWIRPSDDLLPNHPELLGLVPGSALVDVAGGLGRVARRLAPAVGRDGIIVSIEMRRILTERARRAAAERNLPNLQFRPGVAQRLPLPDSSMDAAVNEWTGVIWQLGLGPAMLNEMIRVVRPGGRIAITHRLVQLRLGALDQPWVQYKEIYQWVREAFQHPELTIVAERVWGQTLPSVAGENVVDWLEHFVPRMLTMANAPFAEHDDDPNATVVDVYLTIVAERLPRGSTSSAPAAG